MPNPQDVRYEMYGYKKVLALYNKIINKILVDFQNVSNDLKMWEISKC